jgi:hypothetical protein
MPDPKLSDEQIASRVRSNQAHQPADRRRRISYSPEKTERWSTARVRHSITASGSDAYFYDFTNSDFNSLETTVRHQSDRRRSLCDTRFIASVKRKGSEQPIRAPAVILLCLGLFALYLAPQALHRGSVALCYGLDYRSCNFLQPAPRETIPIVSGKIR